jgi:poly-beta-1,6-N-acetyl-D-glucosamine synthase
VPGKEVSKPKYISVHAKFSIALAVALAWSGISAYWDMPWLGELANHIGFPLALLLILGVAIIPGFMNSFLLAGLLLDKRKKRVPLQHYPPLTILIAAYNEASSIVETITSIEKQNYSGELEVIVINDGSADATAELVSAQTGKYPWLKLVDIRVNGGKAAALNRGLPQATHGLVVTIDADSYLYHNALQSIVERYLQDPPNTRAVAGTVLVRNSRTSWIAKAQEWDYFHGISAIKRVQSLFQGTLVAQGAFSIYDRDTLVQLGGWPDCIGEDIVLTWAFLKAGYRVGHSEDACLFTDAPATLKQFSRQRQRWSRGMIEAFKYHPGILLKARLSTFFVYWNLAFPLLDLIFTLGFIPGLVLALFGHYWIVGPMTLALLPIALGMNYLMFSIGSKMFRQNSLLIRYNPLGFFIYALAYSLIMQPVCLAGYLSEIFRQKKTWGTK